MTRLICERCGETWSDTYRTTCPSCGSADYLWTDRNE